MAFVLSCLKCGARLRSATRLRAGRRLTCPTCRAGFTLHADAEPEAPKAGAIPDAVLLDEPDDDRPPARGRRDDEDDDRPPVGGRRRGPADDDRPPVGGRRRRAVSPPVLLGVLIGGFFILLALGAGGYFLFRKATAPAAADLLAYAPADSVGLAGYDLDAIAAADGLRRAVERRPPADLAELDRAGFRPADMSQALVARSGTGIAAAVRFKAPQDRARYLQAEVTGRPYAPFASVSGPFRFGYFPDARTLVLADREATLQDVIDGGGRPRVSNKLRALADRARGPVWRATGPTAQFDRPRFGRPEETWLWRLGPTTGSVAWLEAGGLATDVHYEIDFESRMQATAGAGLLRGQFAVRRGLADAGPFVGDTDPGDLADTRRGYETATVADDGLNVTARVRLPAAEALKAVEVLRP